MLFSAGALLEWGNCRARHSANRPMFSPASMNCVGNEDGNGWN